MPKIFNRFQTNTHFSNGTNIGLLLLDKQKAFNGDFFLNTLNAIDIDSIHEQTLHVKPYAMRNYKHHSIRCQRNHMWRSKRKSPRPLLIYVFTIKEEDQKSK